MQNITKRVIYYLLIIFCFFSVYACTHLRTDKSLVRLYEKKEGKNKPDRPDLALLYDIKRTKDPVTGTVPYERRNSAYNYTRQKLREKAAITGITWTERGPNNIGGRVKALMFDPNDAGNGYKKVWAGGADGGLWYNNDITDANSSWHNVDDFWANMAVSAIAYDPSNTQIFYVGTGEGWYNADAVKGAGIWKTTDGGTTWTQLASTTAIFLRVQKIVVTSTGNIIVSDRNNGIYRSTDGGTNWTNTISGERGADVEKAANGDLYCSTGVFSTGKIYKSTDNGASWTNLPYGTATGTPQRIELACAPNNAATVYAVGYNGAATGSNDVSFIKRSTDNGASWTTITRPGYITNTATCAQSATHYTRAQAWYSSILKVHPTNSACLLAGGIDLFRSTDATDTPGTNVAWSPLSYWTGVTCSLPIVHADQHDIAFHPTDPNQVIFGNDGGVYYSPNAGNTSVTQPTISARIKNFNITQFYAVGTRNTQNSSFFIAGAQDNGSLVLNGFQAKPGREGTGGDGAFCFVDQDNSNNVITAYTNNNYYCSTDGGTTFSTTLLSDSNTGEFINPAAYDSQANILYTNQGTAAMYRVTGIGGTPVSASPTITVSAGATYISAIKVSPNTANTIFVATDDGFVYRVANAHTGNMTATRIGSTTAIAAGTVSSIDVGASDNQLLIVFSNYGINSVFETLNASSNGTATWTNKDNATIPDMPIRWGIYNPSNRNQVMLATETGVYTTDDFNAGSPVWGPASNNIANIRCDMIQYRAIDKTVVVATHGRGIFTTDIWADPYADFDYTRTSCNSVQFNDGSLKPNNSWAWDVNGDGVTDYTTQNPTHTYTAPGVYSVRLTIANGTVSTTKTNYLSIVGTAPTTSSCSIANNSNQSNTIGLLNVSLGTINNTTPPDDGTYKDYSCEQSTVLNPSTSYTLTLKVGDGLNAMSCRAYLDYNNDGDFADAGELLGTTASSTTTTQTITFTTSASPTTSTNLRLRVLSKFSTSPTSCSDLGTYGQAEDYSVIFADAITWTGNTNTDWHTASNWNPAIVPNSFNDVTLPTGRTNYPNLVTNTPVCKNLTINNGASLTIGDGGTVIAGGDLTCAGTLTYAGTTAQTALAQAANITGNLVINNTAGVKLANTLTISGTLTISNGKLDMNGNNIDLGTTGTLVETRSADKVVYDSQFGVQAKITASSRVINNTYTDVAGLGLELNRGTAGSLTVTVARQHNPANLTTSIKGIKKLFKVTTVSGSVTAGSMRIYYAPSETNGLATGEAQLWRYSAGSWAGQTGTYVANAGNPYIQLAGSINAFSDWTAGNTSTPMPVSLLYFKGERQDAQNVKLTWATSQELNNSGFGIERSLDATNFTNIAFIDGLGTSSVGKVYTYLDKFEEGAYYRLAQKDVTGRQVYSPLCYVEGSSSEKWLIYPNPTQGEVKLLIPRKALGQGNIKIRILQTNGQQLASIEAEPAQIETELNKILARLEAGIYLIEGQNSMQKWQQKLSKK